MMRESAATSTIDSLRARVAAALPDTPELIAVYLFGSTAQGTSHRFSDIDIAVLLDPALDRRDLAEQGLALGTRLEAVLSGPVDVVVLNLAPPLLQARVIQTGIVLLDLDRTRRCLFQMQAMNRYYDAKRFMDMQHAALLQRIRDKGLGRGYHGDHGALEQVRRLRAASA